MRHPVGAATLCPPVEGDEHQIVGFVLLGHEPPGDVGDSLGVELAEKLLKQGADVILREVYGANADTSGEKLLEN